MSLALASKHERAIVISILVLTSCILEPWALGSLLAEQGQPQVFGITLREDPRAKPGRVATLEGVAGPEGHRFVVENLDILQPVAVAVVAREPSRTLRVQLLKYDWGQPDQSSLTDADGVASFRVRTQGDLKIFVGPEGHQPAPYYMVVWVGDEIVMPMSQIIAPASEYAKRHPSASVNGMWSFSTLAIITLLAIIGLALIGVFLRLGKLTRKGG
jgi:hypothetical protein